MELAIFRVDVYDEAGTPKGSLIGTAAGGEKRKSGFLSVSCLRRVNGSGLLVISLRGDHALLGSLADKWQFELWRKPTGMPWAREFAGIFRAGNWRYDNKSNIVLYCPGVLTLLSTRIINYPANTADRTAYSFVPAETISKSLVTYNVTSSATTGNGRKRNGTAWPATQITVEADDGGGNILPWYCFGENLLEALQKLAMVGGGDFDLVKTGATAYEFRWYEGQLGDDLSGSVKFSLGLGNMGSPQVDQSWTNEKTVACVWGQGEDDARAYATRLGRNYSATNDIEMYVNASDIAIDDLDGLDTRGDEKLSEAEAERTFRFNALQAPATLYGVHYHLGDLVTVVEPLSGIEYVQQVSGVNMTLAGDGRQGLVIELSAARYVVGS